MADDKTVMEKDPFIEQLISRALEEDIKGGDVTTDAIIAETTEATAIWMAKEQGVVAGLDIAEAVFQSLDPELNWQPRLSDGDMVEKGKEIVEFHGSCRAILTAERTALNLVQRMSGIASRTRQYVARISDLDALIMDTRKTVPGLRMLDKYAVEKGGGTNHRMGLYDLAMIKDNHIVAAGSIDRAVRLVREQKPDLKVEVETVSLEQVKEALEAGADIIMLDNMSPAMMNEAVTLIGKRAKTEASGNITLETVRTVAETGVDYISVGALTHSVSAFDISQQLQNIY